MGLSECRYIQAKRMVEVGKEYTSHATEEHYALWLKGEIHGMFPCDDTRNDEIFILFVLGMKFFYAFSGSFE